MADTPLFTSPRIADEIERVFGAKAKKVAIDMKYHKQVGDFVVKVERAHEEAQKSKQVYK